MMASFAASLPPPLRRFPRGATLSASHGGAAGLYPLRPRPRRRALVCRADLLQDAPFAAAIGTCVLASLALPPWRPRGDAGDDEGEEGEFSATDMRIGVMEIISFLPYFNWLSWIFAWMDSGKRRYLVYAAVYLSPYLRTNLSLSPEESWLPIASIFICILHIQLEIAIRNYDNEIFQFLIFEVNESFRLVVRFLYLVYFRAFKERDFGKERDSEKTGHRPNKRIPSAHEFRERLRNSAIFKRRLDDPIDEKRNKSDRD